MTDTGQTWWEGPQGRVRIQHAWQADAGIHLSDGARWWGTRARWRFAGERRWRVLLLVDVHPFDYEAITAAIRAAADNATGAPQGSLPA